MIPQQTIESIKQVSIVNYLYSLGVMPVKLSGVRLVYFSPKNEERTASFFVHPKENTFHDFTNGERGDIIRLVRYLTNCTFTESVAILQKLTSIEQAPTFSFIGQNPEPMPQESKFTISSVTPLKSKGLLQYVHDRGISTAVAQKYLKEIHYRRGNKKIFAVGFENDKGGFEIRNPYWKSSTSPKWITTFFVPNSTAINLFEGFFDFLSSCCFFGSIQPRNTTVVLNSLSNLNHVIESLKIYKQVNVYFDNDKAGFKAKEVLQETGCKLFDGSKYYPNHNDFNSFLTDGKY